MILSLHSYRLSIGELGSHGEEGVFRRRKGTGDASTGVSGHFLGRVVGRGSELVFRYPDPLKEIVSIS
jgi:hypothetical protein